MTYMSKFCIATTISLAPSSFNLIEKRDRPRFKEPICIVNHQHAYEHAHTHMNACESVQTQKWAMHTHAKAHTSSQALSRAHRDRLLVLNNTDFNMIPNQSVVNN